MGSRLFAAAPLLFCLLAWVPARAQTLVPPDERISDRQARTLLAELLAYQEETRAEALAQYRILARLNPEDALPGLAMADILLDMGRPEEAEAVLTGLARTAGDDPRIARGLGEAFFRMGRMGQAADFFARARELGDASPEVEDRLARALVWSGQEERALDLLETLRMRRPNDPDLALVHLQALAAAGRTSQARELADELVRTWPENPDILAAAAQSELSLGHAARARDLYQRALAVGGGPGVRLALADARNLWGDFYRAEAEYEALLAEGPGQEPQKLELALRLAGVLAAMQRLDEAWGAYRIILLDHPGSREARLGLAEVLARKRRFGEGLAVLAPLVEQGDPEARLLAATILLQQDRPQEAADLLEDAETPAERTLLARALVDLDREEGAEVQLLAARDLEPDLPEARLLLAGGEALEESFANDLARDVADPAMLQEWAGLYTARGRHDLAVLLQKRALELDPEYFPARMGLAESLSYRGENAKSLEMLQALEADYPGAAKIMLTRARVLAWDRRFEEAVDQYEALRRADAEDPVPLREMARVRFWDKKGEEGAALYALTLDPPVDRELAAGLERIARNTGDPVLEREAQALGRESLEAESKRGWAGYESLLGRASSLELGPRARKELERLMAELAPAWRIQKSFALEREAKTLAFERRFSPAMEGFAELSDFEPANQEAVFDQAQAACALGLEGRERRVYEELLEIDPRHTLAGKALDRLDHRRAPALGVRSSFWEEDGHGRLSAMVRYRTEVPAEVSLDLPGEGGHRLQTASIHWVESPLHHSRTYQAWGQSLSLSGVVNRYLSYDLGVTGKFYEASGLDPVFTGRARAEFNLEGLARVGIGWERLEEAVNQYALLQQVAADDLVLDWWIPVTRRVEVWGDVRNRWYSDSNAQRQARLNLGWSLTDHPRQLRVVATGEWRDTEHEEVYHYQGADLVDITHPYWSPEHYFAGSATLLWRHDLAEDYFCGARRHWYELGVSTGTDTEDNPMIRLTGEWLMDAGDDWTLHMKALWHRSPKWDATGLWAGVQYHF